jgi:Sodium/hydrogen exchanger family
MATTTVTQMVTRTIHVSATASSTLRAAPQGGILEGGNPSQYNPSNPIILFIIQVRHPELPNAQLMLNYHVQAGIILIFCRILHFPLSRLRQPRVIAEVIAGILLGPSVMGRIPGFNNAIFPTASMPALTLAANLGLVFFLFLVGLEVDLRYLASNWRIALSVGAAGMALPFGLGCAIAWGLYNQFRNDAGIKPISFPVYMLFIGVAMAITVCFTTRHSYAILISHRHFRSFAASLPS